jgi:hypothetical protein
MSDEARGYVTLAAGSTRYLEMAVDMALSLRAHTSHPMALIADEAVAEVARTHYEKVFARVCLIGEDFREGRARKYGVAEATPWEESVFIDADCLVLGSLDHLWESLDSHDMAFLGELLSGEDDENHHGFSTRSLMRRFGLDHYLKTNSGLFCFRREPSIVIMRECLDCFLNEARPALRLSILRGAWIGDEIAIGIVGGRRRLGTLPKPAEMYWPTEFDSLDLGRPNKPLLHMIWPLPPSTFLTMCAEAEARRSDAGVRTVGSDHWQVEQSSLQKMANRRRWMERLRIW